jgi:hypothetical protein
MTSEVAALLSPYRGRGLLLDANLLLVLAIGQTDPLLIERHKKTRGEYVSGDFDLLFDMIGAFAPCFTTPHILTEVSNQLGQGSETLRYALFQAFAALIPLLRERCTPCQDLANYNQFPVFGLTDMGILDLAQSERSLVISADSPLVAYLNRAGVDAIDFRRIKTLERGG